MPRPPIRLGALALVCAAAACRNLEREPEPDVGEMTEPDVFDVIRASNSKAAVEALRDRYEQEVQHARLLEARIGELIAAEEGLALEHHERMEALQAIKDQVRKLADEQAETGRALEEASKGNLSASARLDALQQENAALERAIAIELARREELRRKLEQARSDGTDR
jgi:chromosome segregation ATPase